MDDGNEREGWDESAIDLMDLTDNGEVWIIRPRSGANTYSQQVSGNMCGHRTIEGVAEQPPGVYSHALPHVGCCASRLELDEADELDAWFRARRLPYLVDRDRLYKSCEAWVWVVTVSGERVVMTWENCD